MASMFRNLNIFKPSAEGEPRNEVNDPQARQAAPGGMSAAARSTNQRDPWTDSFNSDREDLQSRSPQSGESPFDRAPGAPLITRTSSYASDPGVSSGAPGTFVRAGGMVGAPWEGGSVDIDVAKLQKPTRVVLVENLPAWVSTAGLWKVFESALLKLRDMQPGGQPLKARFVDEPAVSVFGNVDASEVEDIVGNRGTVLFSSVNGDLVAEDLVQGSICTSFGPLRRVYIMTNAAGVCAEYWDVRSARRCAEECGSVGGVEVGGVHLNVELMLPVGAVAPTATSLQSTPAGPTLVAPPLPSHLRPPAAARNVLSFSDFEDLRRRHGGGSGNSSVAPSPSRLNLPVPDDPPSGRGSSPSVSDRGNDSSPTPDTLPPSMALNRNGSPSLLGLSPQVEDLGEISAYLSGPLRSARPLSHASANSSDFPQEFATLTLGGSADQSGYSSAGELESRRSMPAGAVPFSGAALHEFPRRGGPKGCAENPNPGPRMIPKANEINLWRVMMGLDKRTTCMVRNIPNKYSQQMLIDFVDETHRGHYDFLYLRIDFKNQCNVGYAFINFIDPSSIVSFAHKVVGRKWSKFNSDKICTLSYANIQGKSALIEKFRNSSVMLEDPTYRPKIFHSTGPQRGAEAPFPPPTIILRKAPGAPSAANLRDSTYSRDSAYGSIRESLQDYVEPTPMYNYLAAQEEERAILGLVPGRRISEGALNFVGDVSALGSLGMTGAGPVYGRHDW
ncbi:hypothetical protein HDU93_005684 [Gonapodya sp. JEL0774]|nr:hypothetical protein HDU93_005684 [Gonapodya sp. JEL0774]